METKCPQCGAQVGSERGRCPRCRLRLDLRRAGRPAKGRQRGAAHRFLPIVGRVRRAVLASVLVLLVLFAAGRALGFARWSLAGVDFSSLGLGAVIVLYLMALPLILYGIVHEPMDFLAQSDPKSWTVLIAAFVAMGLLMLLLSVLSALR